jgi:GH15 family glucan-1,4-alpha-glucosidase
MHGVSADAAPDVRIGAYAVVGEGRSVALVSIDGSLDWLCWPRFDSPSVFAALLDDEAGGRWSIQPAGEYRATRRYIPDTNILETTFSAPDGEVVLRDLMPVGSEPKGHDGLFAEHELLREVECVSGDVEMTVHYDPRPDYGQQRARLVDRGAVGVACPCRRGMLLLRSEAPATMTRRLPQRSILRPIRRSARPPAPVPTA